MRTNWPTRLIEADCGEFYGKRAMYIASERKKERSKNIHTSERLFLCLFFQFSFSPFHTPLLALSRVLFSFLSCLSLECECVRHSEPCAHFALSDNEVLVVHALKFQITITITTLSHAAKKKRTFLAQNRFLSDDSRRNYFNFLTLAWSRCDFFYFYVDAREMIERVREKRYILRKLWKVSSDRTHKIFSQSTHIDTLTLTKAFSKNQYQIHSWQWTWFRFGFNRF